MKVSKISKIEIYKVSIPTDKPFKLSLGVLESDANLLVRIHADDGLYGWGEGSFFPFIVGETQEIAFEAAKAFARLLLGKNPWAIENRMRELDAFLTHNRTAKSAFDMALYDLLAKRAGLPLYALLGGEKRPLITNLTMGIGSPQEMAETAQEFKLAGARFIKTKLGAEPEGQVDRIRAIRDKIGHDIPIRIDANQAWDSVTAVHILRALAPYNIQYCEEPVPHWNNSGLRWVREKSPIPVMADESLFDHHDAFRLASMGACDYFNIKLCKAGGIHLALKIAAIAEAAGMKCQLGSMHETRLGMSANAHLALARPQIAFVDLDGPMRHSMNPVIGGVAFLDDGTIEVPDRPGHGADVDMAYLEGAETVCFEGTGV
jgi:L-alanine-DL-glutamate epimerase-like enolase superfamily enzyme